MNPPDSPPESRDAILVLDAAVGASLLAGAAARMVGRQVRGVVNPVAVVFLRPPMLAEPYQAGTYLDMLARQGVRGRDKLERQASAMLDNLVAPMVAGVLERIDLAKLADGVVAEVDLADVVHRSTGAVATDTDDGVGMPGTFGDESVRRLRVRFSRRTIPAAPPADQPLAETAPVPEPPESEPPASEPGMTST